jgi:hypothetical protein
MKSDIRYILILLIIAVAFFPGIVSAQLNQGGIPSSFSLSLEPEDCDMVTVTPPVMDFLQREDEQTPLPYRFAVNLPVSIQQAIGKKPRMAQISGD